MDESLMSFEQAGENARRSFWSLRLRKKIVNDDASNGCNGEGEEEEEDSPTMSNAKSSCTWKCRKKVEKKNMKDRKKSRLSIWKSWFLTLIKSKSKSSLKHGMQHPELVDLNCVPSFGTLSAPLDLDTDEILQHFTRATIEKRLGMAITLPEGVRGKDIRVNVEMKVLPKGCLQNPYECKIRKGLHLLKITQSGPVYSGTTKVPSMTNILQVSQMPLYLLSGDCSESEQIVETIIKPVDNILPDHYDKTILVDAINLRLQFLTQLRFTQPELSHEFLSDIIPILDHDTDRKLSTHPVSQISFDFDFDGSLVSLKTDDLIDQITEETDSSYDESSKNIVKGILNQVVSKLSFRSSTDLIEDFHKELEVQKMLLLETTSSILPNSDSLLSKISETEQEDACSTRTCSKTSSKSSSKNLAQDMVKLSDLSLSNDKSSSSTNSELKFHLTVPANTPDTLKKAEEQKRLAQKKMLKEEVKADIDKTLELLETAKNKLLSYLNQGQAPNEIVAGTVDSVATVKVIPFKHLDSVEFFPETAQTGAEKVSTEIQEEVKESKDEESKGGSIMNCIENYEIDSSECTDFTDYTDDSQIKEGPTNHPVHELKHMLLDEFKKQTEFPPMLTEGEVFDLENLAHANVFLNNKAIRKMTDHYLTLSQITLLEEYDVYSHNSTVFEQRYPSTPNATNPSAVTQGRLNDDIDIILQELLDYSEAIKKGYFYIQEKKAAEEVMADDVECVLEQLLQRVEKQVTQIPQNPQVYQVNPVYFCLIDDYVDVFPTAGRACDGSPLAWLAHRLRASAATERRSTISVRRCLSNGQKKEKSVKQAGPDGLLEKLEKGATYLSELYKEIYSSPFNFMRFEHPECTHHAMDKKKEKKIPLLRKSNKILSLAEKNVQPAERETIDEHEQRVINPEKERSILKIEKMQSHAEHNQSLDLTRWPSWQRDWIKIFAREHSSDEVEGLRRLTDLIKINGPERKNLVEFIKIPKITKHSFMKKQKDALAMTGSHNSKTLTPDDNDQGAAESIESNSGQVKIVNFANSDDDDTTKPKLTEKKTFQVFNVPPVYSNDSAMPGTSRTNENDLFMLHEEKSNAVFASHSHSIILSDEIPATKIYKTVAGAPKGFASSGVEQAYLNNIAVLEEKVNSSTLFSTSSSSSDESYQQKTRFVPPVVPNFRSNTSILSKANYLSQSASGSEVSSRSAGSPAVSSDYFADIDTFSTLLPDLRPEYISQPELNQPEEVAMIEDNILTNERLNPMMKSLSLEYSSKLLRARSSVDLSSVTSVSLESTTMDLHGRK